MTIRACFAILCRVAPALAWGQQANVNLEYNPQKHTENLSPFSAPFDSPAFSGL